MTEEEDQLYWGEWSNEKGDRWVRDRNGSWQQVSSSREVQDHGTQEADQGTERGAGSS